MLYIALAAVTAILLLQSTGAIPLASVGGSLTIGLCFLVAALAVGLHEAWTKQRGVLGWIVNVVVTFIGALVGAQFGGLVVVMLIGAIMDVNGSLARTGGLAMSAALAGGMLATLFGAWAALWIVNRWRSDPKPT
ncbi:hypothetical protein [Rhodopseudomonas sp. P2A-2r]|uniref:hypothetical protein n=1 Tax=unclassified Rhodopseudomonas TaxID=2638247 RepID=UPI00223404FE|nr:hypothetical protein [Rhodopseudomonas sp. P2A-2r]UZE51463.1 hypothetical protein ONR75_13145 [Rhodopseudomonas sp. P2A-2r]